MSGAKEIKEIVIDGHHLTLEELVAVARFGAAVRIGEEAMEAMKRSRELTEKIAAQRRVAYGITTGFGDFATVAVPEAEVSAYPFDVTILISDPLSRTS